MKKIDLTGMKFGHLTVLSEYDRKSKQIRWECLCICGKKTITFGNNLKRRIPSCGCVAKKEASIRLKISATTHGFSKTRTYETWWAMKARTENPKHLAFHIYSNKKITICERWHKFENFLKDMGVRPKDKTLDRIDNSKGYYLENCRWATSREQGLNRDTNRIMELNNKKQTMLEWSEELNIKYSTLSMRVNNSKWSDYKALTTPVRKRSKNNN